MHDVVAENVLPVIMLSSKYIWPTDRHLTFCFWQQYMYQLTFLAKEPEAVRARIRGS
jgi:hypothetical protein